MEYYYTKPENVDLENKQLTLEDFEYKHLAKVLRKKAGDEITITDGEKNIYVCTIAKIAAGKILCGINEKKYNINEPEIYLKLFIAPLRNNNRFEFAIEKAVELGVSSIYPVATEFTVNKTPFSKSKIERLNKIIIYAMGQSQRCFLPKIENVITLDNIFTRTKNSPNKILMYEYAESNKKSEINKNEKEISLLIGPEGGFSKSEINKLIKENWQMHSLGERKIRAETAAIVSVFELLK